MKNFTFAFWIIFWPLANQITNTLYRQYSTVSEGDKIAAAILSFIIWIGVSLILYDRS